MVINILSFQADFNLRLEDRRRRAGDGVLQVGFDGGGSGLDADDPVVDDRRSGGGGGCDAAARGPEGPAGEAR